MNLAKELDRVLRDIEDFAARVEATQSSTLRDLLANEVISSQELARTFDHLDEVEKRDLWRHLLADLGPAGEGLPTELVGLSDRDRCALIQRASILLSSAVAAEMSQRRYIEVRLQLQKRSTRSLYAQCAIAILLVVSVILLPLHIWDAFRFASATFYSVGSPIGNSVILFLPSLFVTITVFVYFVTLFFVFRDRRAFDRSDAKRATAPIRLEFLDLLASSGVYLVLVSLIMAYSRSVLIAGISSSTNAIYGSPSTLLTIVALLVALWGALAFLFGRSNSNAPIDH